MRFIRYIAPDILLAAFAILTLPLWLPFWLWISFREWLECQRFYWKCAEDARKRDAERSEVKP